MKMLLRTFGPTHVLLAASILMLGALGACDGVDDEPLDTTLDAERNVVEASPVDFAPGEGGVGEGTYGDELPLTIVVLAQGALEDAGETNCGQFSSDEDDLELTLYGTLKPGTWSLGGDPADGTAEVRFAGRSWTGGTVQIDEGSETRGDIVSGTIEVTSDAEERFAMRFSTLFHGCGRD